MSTDWGKHSSALETQRRAKKNPENNGVISLIVGPLRNLTLDVIHNPAPVLENPAHTDVKGIDKDMRKLFDIVAALDLFLPLAWNPLISV